MATTTTNTDNNPKQENPSETLEPTAPKSDTDPTKDADAGGDSKGTTPSEAGNDPPPLSDVEKKIRRAERFGISVQLSEKEKRNSRAERFGTATASAPLKSEELLKRKARAERFGMPTPSTAADEEAKKKARLARFAPASKVDPLEEDKRKARALRFSDKSATTSLSQVNGNGNIEPEAAVASKTGGGT